MTFALNVADVCEAIADTQPDEVALIHGDRSMTWRDLDRRASCLAGALARRGVVAGTHVGLYLYNGNEYLETTLAALKLRAVPFNINYRYREAELEYLLDNADAAALIFDADLSDVVARAGGVTSTLRALVASGDTAMEPGAERYEDLIGEATAADRIERSPDDLLMLYTGGTTGMPKGVLWPVATFFGSGIGATYDAAGVTVPSRLADVPGAVRTLADRSGRPVLLAASPLMHGVGLSTSVGVLCLGGAVVTLSSRRFDAQELWRAVVRQRVTHISIVGDPFARPMVAALEAQETAGKPYDLSSVRRIVSAGSMWSTENKRALLERAPVELIDTLASSEAAGLGQSRSSRADPGPATATFAIGRHAVVLTADGRRIDPGSAETGVLAVSYPIPIGYYKDEARTARTFVVVDGVRYALSGDHARVAADGAVVLLGRGSLCINTGGEKVFPEEVEEVVKTHPAVIDCLVVGIPDASWGEAVVAVASTRSAVSEEAIRSHVRARLAGFKVPKAVRFVGDVPRSPNGKADYAAARALCAPPDPSAASASPGGGRPPAPAPPR